MQVTLDGILEGQNAIKAELDSLATTTSTQHRHWECDEIAEEIPDAIVAHEESTGRKKAEHKQHLDALQDKFDDDNCNEFIQY
jgi:hypothetical protein